MREEPRSAMSHASSRSACALSGSEHAPVRNRNQARVRRLRGSSCAWPARRRESKRVLLSKFLHLTTGVADDVAERDAPSAYLQALADGARVRVLVGDYLGITDPQGDLRPGMAADVKLKAE